MFTFQAEQDNVNSAQQFDSMPCDLLNILSFKMRNEEGQHSHGMDTSVQVKGTENTCSGQYGLVNLACLFWIVFAIKVAVARRHRKIQHTVPHHGKNVFTATLSRHERGKACLLP
ncbi:hypothetical protein U9M48_038945 [Paspalum notatum var. saurae]|uniref:Uncharacterized protein n=1 Tax=Paspalum notatum var. saurae TaxID=547442 RepID=A0AAQ3UHV6_PASNO